MNGKHHFAKVAAAGAVCMFALSWPAFAGTVYVNGTTGNDAWSGLCDTWDGATCGPKLTIQAGINAAVAGDTVLVADGTYTGTGNKDLDFGGKPITVRSASGDPATCIIDCQGSGRGFYFHSHETSAATVAGLSIRNGKVTPSSPGSSSGGGVYCSSSSPTLTGCTISGNTAASSGSAAATGGGVYCNSSNPTLTNCTISGNTVSVTAGILGASGGGIYCASSSSPILTSCTVSGNSAAYGAGVVYPYIAPVGLKDCLERKPARQCVRVRGSGIGKLQGVRDPTLVQATDRQQR